jgi:hypothetical protein
VGRRVALLKRKFFFSKPFLDHKSIILPRCRSPDIAEEKKENLKEKKKEEET